MCVIVHLPKKVTLSKQLLQNCYDNNHDGWGIMALVDGKMQVSRSVGNFDAFYEEWRNYPRDVERAVHFRIATHGTVSLENCHPFRVFDSLTGLPAEGSGNDIWMMHNGIIRTVEIDQDRSDTYHFAEHDLGKVISTWGEDALTKPEFLKMVEKGSYASRLLFMDTQGRSLRTDEKAWHKEFGGFFSNDHSHEKYEKYVSGPYRGAGTAANSGRFWDSWTKDWNDDYDDAATNSDTVPYGRAEPVHKDDDPMTIGKLYTLDYEQIYDWICENPEEACEVIVDFMSRPMQEMGVA